MSTKGIDFLKTVRIRHSSVSYFLFMEKRMQSGSSARAMLNSVSLEHVWDPLVDGILFWNVELAFIYRALYLKCYRVSEEMRSNY